MPRGGARPGAGRPKGVQGHIWEPKALVGPSEVRAILRRHHISDAKFCRWMDWPTIEKCCEYNPQWTAENVNELLRAERNVILAHRRSALI